MKQEFKLLKVIIADYTPEDYDYEPVDGRRTAKREDYDMVDVIPVSDPNAATMAQKIVTYQAVLQLAQSAPQLYNLPLLHRQMIEILGVKNANKLVPVEDDQMPVDPVQENQNILTQKPVKAFVEQNHDAHMMAHQSFMQNPHIQQMLQQNPMGQGIMSAALAHINEHMAFKYRLQVEQMLGQSLPPMVDSKDDQKAPEVPKEMADQIAMMAAQATQQLLQQDQQQMQQQAAQQNQQDPVLQMQMQELQIKQQEVEIKKLKIQVDGAAKADELNLKKQDMESRAELEMVKITQNSEQKAREMQSREQLEGTKIGVDIAKSKHMLNRKSKGE